MLVRFPNFKSDDYLLSDLKTAEVSKPLINSFSALIGEIAIPRVGVLEIDEVDCGYKICGRIRDEKEKLEILRSLGCVRRGQVQKAKFITKSGELVNGIFEIAESRFDEQALPDSRLLEFTILLKQPQILAGH